jgi:aspartokinase-like uncharacterized kinase
MEAVIKIGGSLAEDPQALLALAQKLSELVKTHRIVVVPGGGRFADVVRDFDKHFALSATVSHRMAILAMDQFGLLLSNIVQGSRVFCRSQSAESILRLKRVPIFLPSKLMFEEDPLENSWDVTSDSIAAFLASRLHMSNLILATDVDGIFTKDPKKYSTAKLLKEVTAERLLKMTSRTSVDKRLPRILLENSLNCYVVNGKNPEWLESILSGQHTVCTQIMKSTRRI